MSINNTPLSDLIKSKLNQSFSKLVFTPYSYTKTHIILMYNIQSNYLNFQAITQDKQDLRNMYECPVYKTRTRGPTFVWTFNLKTKDKPSKWTLAGVALLLQV